MIAGVRRSHRANLNALFSYRLPRRRHRPRVLPYGNRGATWSDWSAADPRTWYPLAECEPSHHPTTVQIQQTVRPAHRFHCDQFTDCGYKAPSGNCLLKKKEIEKS